MFGSVNGQADPLHHYVAYRLVLIHSTCSSNLQSELYITQSKHTNCTMTVLERDHPAHWHHAMQKNSSSTETVQRYLRKVLHFHRQNLMLISPPND